MDNLNVLGTLEELRTLEELTRIVNYFKKELEMKDFWKIKLCLNLPLNTFQVES